MYRFEKLRVWQKAMEFCELVYEKSKTFPKEEIYGLTSQFRRAATSIPLNIAEGSACRTKKEFVQFLTIALRSQYEIVTIIELAKRLRFLDGTDHQLLVERAAEVGKLLQALINSLSKKSKNQQLKTKR
jgi:four helix bundle protein